ncbi:MAG: TonB family protein [Bacteroidales bacterium]|nr:TonB family protein [Bacteroidales bacterium]
MEAIASYLLQMACWLAAFWLVYVLALRKETFFELNRWFLLVGIMAAFVLPLFPIKYEVVKNTADSTLLLMTGKLSETSTPFEDSISYWYWIYGIGAFIVFARFLHQCIKLLWLIRKSEPIWVNNTRVFKFEGDTAPFSFFNFIFVSKTMDNEAELKTVVAHEKVHINERHWADLLLLEVARTVQWFNPLLLLYRKAIMQNHEYLADYGTLQNGVSAQTYKAVLVNQMLGVPVLKVANGFTLFNPTKRIFMMNKNKTKPAMQLKLLWALPLVALIMVSFAQPNYVTGENPASAINANQKTITVNGKVTNEEGEPLPGASIVIKNGTLGTISNLQGRFLLEGVKPDDEIAISFVGYGTQVLKAKSELNVSMKKEVFVIGYATNQIAPPPPPPPPMVINRNGESKKPLIILDGKPFTNDVSTIKPETIDRVEVLKDESAIATYGDKAKDGVIIITSKKNHTSEEEVVFVVVEEMPQYNGGSTALHNYLSKATKGSKEKGNIWVQFIVKNTGEIVNARIQSSNNSKLDQKALEIVNAMPKWIPGKQRGKAVDVMVSLNLIF